MASRHQSITYSTREPANADIVGFGEWLANVFGSRSRGLAEFVRLTAAYRLWRRRHEWCPQCRRFAPIADYETTGACAGVTTYCEHDDPKQKALCRNSGRTTRWSGADGPDIHQITQDEMRQLAEREATG